jgi:hypothetical protein
MASPTAAPRPECVESLFWDVDANCVNDGRHRDFVIGRVLAAGTLDAIHWARMRFRDDEIREWIVRHQGRQLSSPQLRFWQVIVGLPADHVDRWLAEPERRLWEGTPS